MAASTPVRPARSDGAPPRRSAPPVKTPVWRAALSALPPRAYAGACLAAIAVTIVANAAFFQHRAAPTPATPEAVPVVARAAAPNPAAEAPQQATPATVLPPARPASAPAAAPSNADPIADLLKGSGAAAPKEDKKLVMAAQSALIKLGYVVKADGDANSATLQALADFQKRHALPVTPTINAHVVKMLSAAVAAGD